MIKAKSYRKYRLLFLMLPVIIPGLVISALGIISISQQQKAKELKIEENHKEALRQIREEIEEKFENAVEKSFRQFAGSPARDKPDSDSDTLQRVLKGILLENPIVKYPFLIDSGGTFIFPFSKKSAIPIAQPSFQGRIDKKVNTLFQEGERLEFKERKILEALKYYVKCLQYKGKGTTQLKPYLFNSIARCYFKLGKYPQAISYYQSIIGTYPRPLTLKTDLSLYFPVLRQWALSYQRMGWKEDAVKMYLKLYEEILQYETSAKSDRFTFFKNEALEYLTLHLPEGKPQRIRFNRAKSLDRLQEFTDLDISLRWRYYEYEYDRGNAAGSERGSGEPFQQSSTSRVKFQKIREFYLANDEKTQFYKAVRGLAQWKSPPPKTIKIKTLRHPVSKNPANIAYKVIKPNPGSRFKDRNIFFGFMVSPGFLTSGTVSGILKKHLDHRDLHVDIHPFNNSDYPFRLLSLPFHSFFPGKALGLYSRDKNYFLQQAQKEIRLNYALMTAFILVLILGIYLFYKYLSREAELVRLKSDFTDSASHTLKTPLTRIRMLTEKLQLGWVTEEMKKQAYFQTILAETDRMTEMINNMLDFSRIEAGRKQYRFEKTSLPEVVREAAASYRAYMRNLGFRLQVEIDDTIPPFALDEEAVKLIVVNLLQNAVKYSIDEKSIFLRLYIEKEKGHAVLEVEDKGIGMKEKDLKRVFERFYRGQGGTVQTVEGSGLGLYLVRHAVDAHNGEIKASSQPGKGSTFTVLFPMEKENCVEKGS